MANDLTPEKEAMLRQEQERGEPGWAEDRRVLLAEIDALRVHLNKLHAHYHGLPCMIAFCRFGRTSQTKGSHGKENE
jgi:hypothetical protein